MEEVKETTTNTPKRTANKSKKTKDKNNINEKELKNNLEEEVVRVMLTYYTNTNIDNELIKAFIDYLRYHTKENKSNNNFSNRVFLIYQYIAEQYSNFRDLNDIVSRLYNKST